MIDVTTLAVTVIHSLALVAGRKYRIESQVFSCHRRATAQQNNEKRAGRKSRREAKRTKETEGKERRKREGKIG